MTGEPTEFDREEFDRFTKELAHDTYAIIGRCISQWSKSVGILVNMVAMLLRTTGEKAGLVLYSINNFHTWLSIIDELFAIDPDYSPLRPEWLEISNRLKKLNDVRVRLAHHTLGPGMSFEQYVAAGDDGTTPDAMSPALRPNKSDTRSKSKKYAPLGMEGLTKFVDDMEAAMDKFMPLIERMEPIYLGPQRRLADQIKQLKQLAEIAGQRGKSNS